METTKTKTEETYNLFFTEQEMGNPNIKRALVNIVLLRTQLHTTEPFVEISSAEEKIMNRVPLFTPIKEYGEGKFPNEIGKLKSHRIVIKK